MKVIDDSGRPKFQVQFKGETKSFFPEEVRFLQSISQFVSQSASQPTNQPVYMVLGTRDKPSQPGRANFSLIFLQNSTNRLHEKREPVSRGKTTRVGVLSRLGKYGNPQCWQLFFI